jgi:hypothetical protein
MYMFGQRRRGRGRPKTTTAIATAMESQGDGERDMFLYILYCNFVINGFVCVLSTQLLSQTELTNDVFCCKVDPRINLQTAGSNFYAGIGRQAHGPADSYRRFRKLTIAYDFFRTPPFPANDCNILTLNLNLSSKTPFLSKFKLFGKMLKFKPWGLNLSFFEKA